MENNRKLQTHFLKYTEEEKTSVSRIKHISAHNMGGVTDRGPESWLLVLPVSDKAHVVGQNET